jgi:hypothetical protein
MTCVGVWQAEGFNHKSVSRYFSGFVGHLVDTLAKRTEGVTDMQAVLKRIEQQLPGIADGPHKALMFYALWHSVLAPSEHRPQAAKFLAKHGHLLERLEAPSFVVGLLTDQMPDWTDDQLHTLATQRRADREKRGHLELPVGFDAALQIMAAEWSMGAGRASAGRHLAGFAVEEMPGYEPLMAWEAALHGGQAFALDLRALVLQTEPAARGQEALDPDTE